MGAATAVKEYKSFDQVELKANPRGEFEALISTFNVPDKRGDIVRRSAFSESIAEWQASNDRVPVIFAHQSEDPRMYIGSVHPDDLRETPIGLKAAGKFDLEDPQGRKVFSQLQARTLKEWSFGYVVQRAHTLADGMRELLAIDLLELGPCLIGIGTTATIATKAEKVDADLVHALAPYRIRLDLAQRRVQIASALARAR